MAMNTTINRRTFLKGAAVGAAGLGLSDAIPTLAAPPRAPVVLNLWQPGSDPIGGPLMQNQVDRFNKTVGTRMGIVVKNNAVSDANNSVKYTTAMTSSGAPDLIMTYSYTPFVGWAANGFIQPVDPYFQQLGFKRSDYYPQCYQMINFGGHAWGLLQEVDYDQFYWNKALHRGAPPSTFDELDALAKRYTEFDKHGNLIRAGLIPWAQGGFTSGGWGTWGVMWGGSFYDFDHAKWTINTPQNRRFLDWYLKYAHMLGGRAKADALIAPTKIVHGPPDPLYQGLTVFSMSGEWFPGYLKQQGATKLKWGVTNPPKAPGVSSPAQTTISGADVFVIPTRAKHVREAAIFMLWLSSPAEILFICVNNSNFPPVRSVTSLPQFFGKDPWMRQFASAMEHQHVVPLPTSPVNALFDQTMGTAVDEVTYGRKSPAQALAEVDQKIATAVAQFKESHPTWVGE